MDSAVGEKVNKGSSSCRKKWKKKKKDNKFYIAHENILVKKIGRQIGCGDVAN